MIKPWPAIRSAVVGEYRVFQVRQDTKLSPRTGTPHDFFVIESVNWVNVIAVTRDERLIMVEQFRHGSGTTELEVPGGMIDHEDDTPLAAGARELREETGYEGDTPLVLGQVYPNPAIMSNTCFTVLVRNCEQKHGTAFDHTEDLTTRLVPIGEIQDLVASGRIRHSMMIVALYLFELWRKRVSGS